MKYPVEFVGKTSFTSPKEGLQKHFPEVISLRQKMAGQRSPHKSNILFWVPKSVKKDFKKLAEMKSSSMSDVASKLVLECLEKEGYLSEQSRRALAKIRPKGRPRKSRAVSKSKGKSKRMYKPDRKNPRRRVYEGV